MGGARDLRNMLWHSVTFYAVIGGNLFQYCNVNLTTSSQCGTYYVYGITISLSISFLFKLLSAHFQQNMSTDIKDTIFGTDQISLLNYKFNISVTMIWSTILLNVYRSVEICFLMASNEQKDNVKLSGQSLNILMSSTPHFTMWELIKALLTLRYSPMY